MRLIICTLYNTRYIIKVIKSRMTRWTGRVTRMGEITNAYIIFFFEKGNDHMDDLSIDGSG